MRRLTEAVEPLGRIVENEIWTVAKFFFRFHTERMDSRVVILASVKTQFSHVYGRTGITHVS